jgi:hypothetical protein
MLSSGTGCKPGASACGCVGVAVCRRGGVSSWRCVVVAVCRRGGDGAMGRGGEKGQQGDLRREASTPEYFGAGGNLA